VDQLPPPLRKYLTSDYWYGKAGIPIPLLDMDFDTLAAGDMDPETIELAKELVEVWNDGGYQGIALFGKPGRGKTSLTVAMMRAYIDHWLEHTASRVHPIKLAAVDPPAAFVRLSEYHDLGFEMMRVEQMLSRSPEDWSNLANDWTRMRDRRAWLREEVEVLVLDDIGKEHNSRSGYTESGFFSLMRGRYDKGLATCLTSNLTGAEFASTYGTAQLSFVHEACLRLDVVGKDYRKNFITGQP
jgi:DNA replication protein DnaC